MAVPRYFELAEATTGDATRVARRVTHERAFVHRLMDEGVIDDPPELVWQWCGRGAVPDVPFTVDAIRLLSPTVRAVMDRHLTPADTIQWLPATVVDPDGQRLPYWVPHFPVHHDFFDPDRTTFGPSGLPIGYTLSLEKLAPHAVTVIPGQVMGYVISRAVADDLKAARITGASLAPGPVA